MVRLCFMATLAVVSAGCGRSLLAQVQGQLQYPDGKPAKELVGCSIVFEATGADGKTYGATGEVDAEGRFKMTTNRPGDGCPIGTNKVSLNPRWPGQADRPDPLPVLDKYGSAETSGLTIEVKPGSNDVKITVEPKPGLQRK